MVVEGLMPVAVYVFAFVFVFVYFYLVDGMMPAAGSQLS